MREIPNDGWIYYFGLFNGPRLVCSSPKALQEITTRTYEFIKPPQIIDLAGRLLGIGLVLSEGDLHKRQRRTFLPIFAPKHIRDMYPIFWAKSCECIRQMTRLVNNTAVTQPATFEVGHWASRVTLDIGTLTMVGTDFKAIADENSELSQIYRRGFQPTRAYITLAILKNYFPRWLIDRIPVRWNRYQDEGIPTIRNICRQLLFEKKQKVTDKTLRDKDLLSVCLRYEDSAKADEEEVIDQMTTFLAAVHETLSVGITWAIYMLCLHPQWQSRLRDEIRTHFPSPDRENPSTIAPTAADLEAMPLMQAFIEEVLRWYPPIPTSMRSVFADTIIDGLFIPAGTRLVMPLKGICRNEKYWGPDGGQFRPERWLTPDGRFSTVDVVSSKYAHLNFMQGKRSCVAQGYSKAEMAFVLGAWVGRLEFKLVDKRLLNERNMVSSGGSFSGKPIMGLHVTARTVEGW
ncbi:MAG: hypothetical protein Q9227_008776 [Pyrenula ochraceoflavens]